MKKKPTPHLNSRRSFVKQTGAVLLGFQVLDLIPNAYAQKPNGCSLSQADDTCNADKQGAPGGKDTDDHCVAGQTPAYDDDASCRAASASGPDSDNDGVCGTPTGQQTGSGNSIHDPDAACNSHGPNYSGITDQDGACGTISDQTGAVDTDQACNDGNWSVADQDQTCHMIASYDKDESCVSSSTPGIDGDDACGYFNDGQRDRDQHCGAVNDPDNTNAS